MDTSLYIESPKKLDIGDNSATLLSMLVTKAITDESIPTDARIKLMLSSLDTIKHVSQVHYSVTVKENTFTRGR